MFTRRFSTSTGLFVLAVITALIAFGLTGEDPRSRGLLVNTLILAGATVALSLPIGTLLAVLIARSDLPGRSVAAILLGTLLFLPLVVQAAGWMAGFGLQGWVTMAYGTGAWLDHWSGAIWVHTVAAIPWVALIVGVALRVVEPEIEEAALLDGTTTAVFFRVTAPRAIGGVAAAAMWVVVMTAGEITVTDLFQVRTYAEELFTQLAAQADPNPVSLNTVAGVLLITSLVMLAVSLGAELIPPTTSSPGALRTMELRRWRVPAMLFVAAIVLLLVGVPIVNLMYKAGITVVQLEEGRQRIWSPWKGLQIIIDGPWRYRRELAESLWIASLAATLASWAAVELGWMAMQGRRRTWFVLLGVAVAFAIPGPVVGMAIVWLLNRPEVPTLVFLYDHTVLPPLIAQTLRAVPVASCPSPSGPPISKPPRPTEQGPACNFGRSSFRNACPHWLPPGSSPSPSPWESCPPAF